jgi:catabolite regulation protein CreA
MGNYEDEFEKDLHYNEERVYNKENELVYSSTSVRRVLDASTSSGSQTD